jgi:hypothetical protein
MQIQTIKWPTTMALLLLLFIPTACQNGAEPAESTPQPGMAEVILPDEHLILGTQATPTVEPTTTVPSPTPVPTPTIPPLYQVQDGKLLVRDEATGSYAPDPAFPEALQGQAASVRRFTSATGRYWVAYDGDNQAIAERFPDEEDTWTNLLANAVAEEPLFNPDWDRELIGFGEQDLVIVDETSGVDDFEFLFVHSQWTTQRAVVSDYHIVSVAQMNKALNYLRATAANQGIVAITENGLELVPSRLPRGWQMQPDETGALQLLDREGQSITGEDPKDYVLFDRITVVISTRQPVIVLRMYRDAQDESETRHFLQERQLLVHHYIPERQLSERYIENDSDWKVSALGLSRATGVLLANPRDLLAQIEHPGIVPTGSTVFGMIEWYTDAPQRFDHYLLGRELDAFELLPRAFDQLIEAEAHFPLRFRLDFVAE